MMTTSELQQLESLVAHARDVTRGAAAAASQQPTMPVSNLYPDFWTALGDLQAGAQRLLDDAREARGVLTMTREELTSLAGRVPQP